MPLFGRYLLKNYLNVLILSLISFITLLLVSRLEEVAKFAASGAEIRQLIFFILYQIAYILPIALPISCLISAMILFQRLSATHELTALRASGISLFRISSPILLAATFFSFLNFYITSEVATSSHLATRKMLYEWTSFNPLLLLQNSKIAHLQNAYVQMNSVKNAKTAKDIIIAIGGDHLQLCLVKDLSIENASLLAENVTILSSSTAKERDHLLIENQGVMRASSVEFSRLLSSKGWKIACDHLKLPLLRIQFENLKQELQKGEGLKNAVKVTKKLEKCKSEMVRRLSLGLAALSFTWMGIAFGMEISRNATKRGLFMVLFLASFSLISFFVAKEFDHHFWLASALFLTPHLLIAICCLWTTRRINRGIV